MIFASAIFLYWFLPGFLLLYAVAPRSRRNLVLALGSYVFYGWWRPDFVLLMLTSTVVDYGCGRAIVRDQARERTGRKWVAVSALVNLGLLAYFKYAGFAVDTANELLAGLGFEAVEWTSIVLPVGISFYTFQTLSYTVDVYRGDAPPVRSFQDFMCYVAMFPQLVAGPIVRYHTIADQLHRRRHSLQKAYAGVLYFQAGLAKKVLLADPLGRLADAAFGGGALGVLDAWTGALAYTFQIYFDFSGYSDMAIGLGLFLGFQLPVNFDRPYLAESVTDFWRRWHITLSRFLRDYLYIPLGGNRKGPVRTYAHLALTMLIGGLWHGAAWTFVVWGAYHGAWLVTERLLGPRLGAHRIPRPARIGATFVVVVVGWVFFRAPTLSAALDYLASMAGLGPASGLDRLVVQPIHLVAGAVAILVTWIGRPTQELVPRARLDWVLPLQLFFVLALLQLHVQDHVPFLYFQF